MSKELPPSRTAEQFVVRFPDGMRDRIKEAAEANNRSMNAEIVARLEESFLHPRDRIPGTQEEIDAFVDSIVEGLRSRGVAPKKGQQHDSE